MVSAMAKGSAPSPQSESVTNELQELTLQPVASLLPLKERKNVLQLKLQQRRTREELVSQGIMPPLKSPAAFHEQRRSLERARTEDYLKRKIRNRPERSELVRMHILEETSAEPSLQAKQLRLKRARLADDLNDKISHRPGPIELIHKNILPVHTIIGGADSPKGDSSSLDEDSSDALSPDQPANHDSPLSSSQQHSPSDRLSLSSNPSPPQFLPQVSVQQTSSESVPPHQTLTNGVLPTASPRPATGQAKSSKSSSERHSQRPKKAKETKPKVKKLKYHQYIPPDQKQEREPPPPMDSSYAKLLQQQQLFLQLQIISQQQQQHYNYQAILPAPPKPPSEPQQQPLPAPAPPPSAIPGLSPSPSRAVPTPSSTNSASVPASAPSSQTATGSRLSQPASADAKPSTLPANLDEFKVAELKQELKLRGLTVSGTKNDLIERLKNYQEQNGGGNGGGGAVATTGAQKLSPAAQVQQPGTGQPTAVAVTTSPHSKEAMIKVPSFPLLNGHTPNPVATPSVMRFSSISSSPPVSPTPSDRSLAGMSPDETSCNGDVFGEMVSSPLTQLTLHPSPDHLEPMVKEEPRGLAQLPSCHRSRLPATAASSTMTGVTTSAATITPSTMISAPTAKLTLISAPVVPQETGNTLDRKDQMLQEKDKQIEELTRMLRQKQQLVETLRLQLEQGKRTTGSTNSTTTIAMETTLNDDDEVDVPNGVAVPRLNIVAAVAKVKEEVNDEKMVLGTTTTPTALANVTVATEAQQQTTQQRRVQMPCSQQTLLRLQQIQRLQQQQQAEQLQMQAQLQRANLQLHQQQQQKLQQLIIQQQQQQKHQQHQQRKQQRPQKQHRKQEAQRSQQQVSQQVFVTQQPGTQVTAPSISLDLLKAHPAPTLVTDSNGNHYLITLTNNSTPEGQLTASPQNKTNGRITLQRLQSTPVKLPSQSTVQVVSNESNSQSKPKEQTTPVKRPVKKAQRAGLHVQAKTLQQPAMPVSAPPNLQPFYFDKDASIETQPSPPPIKQEVCLSFDRHTLFTPPPPKQTPLSTPQRKENGSSSQHIDDLFDILIKTGEISSNFKANPDPTLSDLHSNPPTPSPPSSPLRLTPSTPPFALDPSSSSSSLSSSASSEPLLPDLQGTNGGGGGGGRLEDFLESTTGVPLLGGAVVDGDEGGPLTLIDELHSQMLSTASILEHPPSPMDTSDLGFAPHPTSTTSGLDFGDPTLDGMDWLDISMGGTSGGGSGTPSGTASNRNGNSSNSTSHGSVGINGIAVGRGNENATILAPLGSQTPPSVFSADFLDSSDLQLHWDSCL